MFTLPSHSLGPGGHKIVNLKVVLNDGNEFPVIGFGTFQISGRDTIYKVLDAAFRAGYRGIDTASVYRNEVDIGLALKELLPKYNLQRKDIYITSKLAPGDHGDQQRVISAVQTSLRNLDLSYLDLYLIHWPAASGLSPADPKNSTIRTNTWSTLVELRDKGLLKSIGVSNYTVQHIRQLLNNTTVKPAVNQVEFHPHWQQSKELRDICKENKILLQAYSSLGGTSNRSLVNDSVILEIAKKNSISSVQVLLRWALQRGYAIIPKSVTPARIEENATLAFELSEEDMSKINNIGRKQKYAWNPDAVR